MKKISKAVRTRKHSFRRFTAGMLAALMVLGGIDPAGISTIKTMAQEASESGRIAVEPAELEESVLEQMLPLGSAEEDIFFPDSLYVTIVEEETGGSSAEELVISTEASEDKDAVISGPEENGAEEQDPEDDGGAVISDEEFMEDQESAGSGQENPQADTPSEPDGDSPETGGEENLNAGDGGAVISDEGSVEDQESAVSEQESLQEDTLSEPEEGSSETGGEESLNAGDGGAEDHEETEDNSDQDSWREEEITAPESVVSSAGSRFGWDSLFTITAYAEETDLVVSEAVGAAEADDESEEYGTGNTDITEPEDGTGTMPSAADAGEENLSGDAGDLVDPSVVEDVVARGALREMDKVPVSWKLNTEYSSSGTFRSDEEGLTFVYDAELSSRYTLAEGAELPSITVTISSEGGRLLPIRPLERVEDHEDGMAYIGFGCDDTAMDEHGRYIVTLLRDGCEEETASVTLYTVDVSARYGTDYEIVQTEEYDTLETPHEATLMELAGRNADMKTNEEMLSSTVEEAGERFAEEIAEDSNIPYNVLDRTRSSLEGDNTVLGDSLVTPDTEDEYEDGIKTATPSDYTEDPHSLAALKRAQTGLPTRETFEQEYDENSLNLISQLIPEDLTALIETSSETVITFEPYETEKRVVIEITDDAESEDAEIFELAIADPNGPALLHDRAAVSFRILDDEPYEYSEISFADPEFTADSLSAQVVVERTEAVYTYVTASVKTSDGTAVSGTNYPAFESEVSMVPFQTKAVVEIPVTGSDRELDFTVELTGLKGVKPGDRQKAKVVIPVIYEEKDDGADVRAIIEGGDDGGEGMSLQKTSAYNAAPLLRAGSGQDDKPTTINISGVGDCRVDWGNTEGYGSIIDPAQEKYGVTAEIGRYYPAERQANKKDNLYRFDYGYQFGWGDNGSTRISEYDSAKGYGRLKWYSALIWEKGGVFADFYFIPSRWQSIFLDRATNSAWESSEHGMEVVLRKNNKDPYSYRKVADSSSQGDFPRGLRGPLTLLMVGGNGWGNGTNNVRENNPMIDDWTSSRRLVIYAKRVDTHLVRPEMYFWGVVLLNREFHVALEQPDDMTYRRAGRADVKEKPCVVSMDEINKVRFLGQSINFRLTPNSTEGARDPMSTTGVINGILDYYEIRVKGSSEVLKVPNTKGNTLAFDEDLVKKIDKITKKVDQTKYGFYTSITVKPHFREKYVTVEVLPDSMGSFTDNDLYVTAGGTAKEISAKYKVGDQLNLAAKPASGYENYFHDTVRYRSFFNYAEKDILSKDDFYLQNKGSSGTAIPLMLKDAYYQVQPCFTEGDNYIEIELTDKAKQYLDVQDLVTSAQIDEEVKKGRLNSKFAAQMKKLSILRVAAPGKSGNAPCTRPVTGDAYTLMAFPKKSAYKKYRPVWTIVQTGEKIQGEILDFIARDRRQYNRIRLDAEPYPETPVYYSVSGHTLFSSYSLRSNGQPMVNQPASEATVYAGVRPAEYPAAGGTKVVYDSRPASDTDEKGYFEVNGIYACHGDTVSMKIEVNGVDQVKYVKLNGKQAGTVDKKITVPAKENGEDVYKETVVACYRTAVADKNTKEETDSIYLPVATPYKPYITNVDYKYEEHVIDTRNNQIGIVDDDILDISFQVKNAENEKVKAVYFEIVNYKGEVMPYRYDTAEDSGVWKGKIRSVAMRPGDQVYAWVESDKTITDTNKKTTNWTSPHINTGLSFYEMSVNPLNLTYQDAVPEDQFAASAPVVGDICLDVDSGTIGLKKKYADPKNPATSAYTTSFLLSMDSRDMTKAYKDASTIWNSETSDASVSVSDKLDAELAVMKDGKTDQEKAEIDKQWNEGGRNERKKELQKENIEKSQAKMNKKANKLSNILSVAFKLVLQFYYVYNPNPADGVGRHECVGGVVGIYVGTNAAWSHHGMLPYPPIPVFVKITAPVGLRVEGKWKFDSARKTAAEMGQEENLAKAFPGLSPWFTFGIQDLELSFGPGFAKGPNIRGFLTIGFLATWKFGSKPDPTTGSTGGVKFSFGGGIQVDLIFFKPKVKWGPVETGTGIYDKSNRKRSLKAANLYLAAAPDDGDGVESTIELPYLDGGPDLLAASDAQAGTGTIDESLLEDKSLEYARPQMIMLDGNRVMLAYLKNSGTDGEHPANAPRLYYAVGTLGEGFSLANAKPVDSKTPDTADSCPALLRMTDVYGSPTNQVFAAWVSPEKPLTADGTDAEDVADDLESLKIWLQEYWITGDDTEPLAAVGDPVCVTGARDAAFSFTELKLDTQTYTENGGSPQVDLVITYKMTDFDNTTQSAASLISMTANYMTMGRSVYDPVAGKIRTFEAGGTTWDTEYVSIPHPTVTDPLLTDYDTVTYIPNQELQGMGATDEYRLETWIADTDADTGTNEDRELWVRVTNLTKGRHYYPIKLYTDTDSGVFSAKFTKLTGGDVMLTFLTEDGLFHTYEADEIWTGLVLSSYIEKSISEGKDPYETGQTAAEETYPDLKELQALDKEEISGPSWYTGFREGMENLLTDRVVRFSDDALSMYDYQIASDDQDNVYLLWSQAGDEAEGTATELWGACFCWPEDADTESGEEGNIPILAGWGEAVQLTHSGRCVDEKAVICSNNRLMMIANSYVIKTGTQDEAFEIGDYELHSYFFEDSNDLELMQSVDLYSSEDHPVPGEQYSLFADVTNGGIFPAKAYDAELVFRKGGLRGTEVGRMTREYRGRDAWIYSGDTATLEFSGDLCDAGKADTVEVRVYETDESGNRLKGKTDYGLEEPYECAYFMLPQEAAYEFGDIEYMDSREARILLALGREELALRLDESISQEEIDARFGSPDTWDERFQEAYALMGIPELESLDEDELAEPAGSYVAIIPVTNLGTDDGVGISANAYIQSYNEDGTVSKGSLIGSHEDAIPKLKPGETMYLAVLLKPAVEDYDANKMLDIRFELSENGVPLTAENLHLFLQPEDNQILELNDGLEETSVAYGQSFRLVPKQFPYDGMNEIYYVSVDSEIASVMPDGTVYGEGNGTTEIFAYDLSTWQLWDSMTVTVFGAPDEEDQKEEPKDDKSSSRGRSEGSSGGNNSSAYAGGPENMPAVISYGSWEQNGDGSWQYRIVAGAAGGPDTTGGLAVGWHYIRYGEGYAWYHFNEKGLMDTGWYKGKTGNWYYLNVSGNEIGTLHTGWLQDPASGKWYYMRKDGADTGRMETGWLLDENDGRWYWLDPEDGGAMAAEKTMAGGPELSFPKQVSGSWEKQPDGKWSFRPDRGTSYALEGSWYGTGVGPGSGRFTGGMTAGGLATGWQLIRYKNAYAWYHFDNAGRMTTGWYQGRNGCWYYLAGSGEEIGTLVTGWFTDPANGRVYYLKEDAPDIGRMAVGWYYHVPDRNWYFFDPMQGGAMITGSCSWEGKEWFFDEKGRWIPDRPAKAAG